MLKKRGMLEVMIQSSLSTSSLKKRAAAAVQAREGDGERQIIRSAPSLATMDYVTFPFPLRRMSRESSITPPNSSSGAMSPNVERRRIHFNEEVEQWIAVGINGDDDDMYSERDDDSDLNSGLVMMKRIKSKKTPAATGNKTIATLPPTTLNDRLTRPSPRELP